MFSDVGAAERHAVELMLIGGTDERLLRRRDAHRRDQLILSARRVRATTEKRQKGKINLDIIRMICDLDLVGFTQIFMV